MAAADYQPHRAESVNGLIFDIQRGSTVDGPGIRTVFFFKGCPFSCPWCHNPESRGFEPETAPDGSVCGRLASVSELYETACKDLAFYKYSGGGVTVSGGEPLAQPEFAAELLAMCKAGGLHTCVDTSGGMPWVNFEPVLPFVDLFLCDFKLSEQLFELTGVKLTTVMANLEKLALAGKKVWLRCVLLGGLNTTDAHFAAIARLERRFSNIEKVTLHCYHPYGDAKRERFGYPPSSHPDWLVAGLPEYPAHWELKR